MEASAQVIGDVEIGEEASVWSAKSYIELSRDYLAAARAEP